MDAHQEFMVLPLYCSTCGAELGSGPGKIRRAVCEGQPICLECADLYDPPTADTHSLETSPEYDHQ